MLAANRALFTVYVLKDDLKALWGYRHVGYAERFWRQWYRRAMSSGIAALKTFAQRLKPYVPGILAHCRWPLGTNIVKGINNIIKRMAYSYRDAASSSFESGPPSPEFGEEPKKTPPEGGVWELPVCSLISPYGSSRGRT